jgi:hypothetical protein
MFRVIVKTILWILSYIVLAILQGKSSRKRPEKELLEGGRTLTYSSTVKCGYVLFIVFSAAIASVAFSKVPQAGQFWAWLGLIIIFFVYGFYGIIETHRGRVTYSPKGISTRSPWPWRNRFVAWQDIQRVSYSNRGRCYVFHSDDGKKMRISSYMNGIRFLMIECKARLGQGTYLEAGDQMNLDMI